MTSALLIFLAVGCTTSGDFCDVYAVVGILDVGVSGSLVAVNRAGAEAIAGNEIYYSDVCRGG